MYNIRNREMAAWATEDNARREAALKREVAEFGSYRNVKVEIYAAGTELNVLLANDVASSGMLDLLRDLAERRADAEIRREAESDNLEFDGYIGDLRDKMLRDFRADETSAQRAYSDLRKAIYTIAIVARLIKEPIEHGDC
jgi:hypothetical protein